MNGLFGRIVTAVTNVSNLFNKNIYSVFLSSLTESDSHERNKSDSGEKPEPAFSMCPMRWLLYRPYNNCRVPSFV